MQIQLTSKGGGKLDDVQAIPLGSEGEGGLVRVKVSKGDVCKAVLVDNVGEIPKDESLYTIVNQPVVLEYDKYHKYIVISGRDCKVKIDIQSNSPEPQTQPQTEPETESFADQTPPPRTISPKREETFLDKCIAWLINFKWFVIMALLVGAYGARYVYRTYFKKAGTVQFVLGSDTVPCPVDPVPVPVPVQAPVPLPPVPVVNNEFLDIINSYS